MSDKFIIPKCTSTDYSFLRNPLTIENGYFKLDTEKSRKHFHAKFGGPEIKPTISLREIHEFKIKYKDQSFLLQKDRVNELDKIFDNTVEQMTTLRNLLVEIQIVIRACINKFDEKTFLCSKVRKLMSTLATPEQLREQQDSSRALNVHYKLKLEKKTELQDQFEKKDFIFVNHILHQYDKYLEKSNETKDVKMRKGLLMLGKWNFLKDWIQERQDEKVFANLYKKLNENEKPFREMIPESEELLVHEFESLDMRRLKVWFINKAHIEEKKTSLTEHEENLGRFTKKKQSLISQVDSIDRKILDIKELMRFKNGDTGRATSASRTRRDSARKGKKPPKVLTALPVIKGLLSAKSSLDSSLPPRPTRKDFFAMLSPISKEGDTILKEEEDDEEGGEEGEEAGPNVIVRTPSEILQVTNQEI